MVGRSSAAWRDLSSARRLRRLVMCGFIQALTRRGDFTWARARMRRRGTSNRNPMVRDRPRKATTAVGKSRGEISSMIRDASNTSGMEKQRRAKTAGVSMMRRTKGSAARCGSTRPIGRRSAGVGRQAGGQLAARGARPLDHDPGNTSARFRRSRRIRESWRSSRVPAFSSHCHGREGMKGPLTIIGVALLILGLISFAYQGITYTKQEKILEVGPLTATKETKKTIPISPVVGGVAVLGGIALLAAGARARR